MTDHSGEAPSTMPGLRDRFADADVALLVVIGGLKLASCLSNIVALPRELAQTAEPAGHCAALAASGDG